jgi:hypothetical protein
MGYSVSQETYERCERNRAAGRLCQGSGRCSARANRIVVCLLNDVVLDEADTMGWRWATFVTCKKHADEMIAWPAFVNGSMMVWTMIGRNDTADQIASEVKRWTEREVLESQVLEAQHRMRVDEAKRAAWSAR